jgi:copper chaperone CopZ
MERMKSNELLLVLPLIVMVTNGSAQDLSGSSRIDHAQTVTVRIDGDCPMCERTIEKVGFVKGEAAVDWDVDAKTAVITFDSTRTTMDAVLQRIAQAGYDNERYLAPKEAYDKLPGCCQYERTLVRAPLKDPEQAPKVAAEDHANHKEGHAEEVPSVMDKPGYKGTPERDEPGTQRPVAPTVEVDHLKPVFDAYFSVKDDLVASDASKAKQHAAILSERLNAVPMEKLDHNVHMMWMKVMEQLKEPARAMAKTDDLAEQRKFFSTLTAPLTELAKASPGAAPIYVDHCPMYEGGANWLSREKPIKNPFYGSAMLTCGSVKETITK